EKKGKRKHVEESRSTPSPTTIRSPRIHSTLVSLDTEKLHELTVNVPPPSSSTPSSSSPKPKLSALQPKLSASQQILSLFKPKTGRFKRYKTFFDELQGRYGYLFEHPKTRFMPRKKFHELAQYLQGGLIMEKQQSQADVAKMIADAIQQDRKNLRTEISSQINNLSLTIFLLKLIHLSGITYNPQLQQDDLRIWLALKYKFERLHVSDTPCSPSAIRPRDQDDPHDDVHPEWKNSAKRQKTSEHGTYVFGESSSGQDNESEPGPSTSGNQEQLDNFDFWTDSYATDDDELPTENVSQELVDEMLQTVDESKLRKVKRNLSLTTSIKAHSSHLKLPKRPKAPTLSLVKQYLLYLKKGNSGPEKIVLSLHKFSAVIFPDGDIEERTSRWVDKCVKKFNSYARYNIIEKRANGSIVSITEPNYKNLNKNDIEDMYLLCINGKKVNLTTPTITFQCIEKYKVFSIVSETVVLEGLKSYNNDVKHGYVTPSLSKEDDEYLQLFEEEIDERLKHRDQMRRSEMDNYGIANEINYVVVRLQCALVFLKHKLRRSLECQLRCSFLQISFSKTFQLFPNGWKNYLSSSRLFPVVITYRR
ncbi:hypothetical protein Tco_0933063, partial [Tanacetum coccineum]